MTTIRPTYLAPACAALLVFACARPADEFRGALPDRDTVQVDVPASDATARGLASKSSALVGAPADYYTMTYYAARDLNGLGAAVVELVETIAEFPPTTLDDRRAVWGPFSEAREPNEFEMTVQKEGAVFVWVIEGRHKSGGDFAALARGAFEPDEIEDFGRGWFALDFEAIRALDPTESGRGEVAYAFEKNAEGVAVRVSFVGVAEDGARIEAGYAFGEDVEGNGFVVFAFPEDVFEGGAREDLLIRTRWIASGEGRADVVARNGDLGGKVIEGSQCWSDTFVSTYESFFVDGDLHAQDGDATKCVLEQAALPNDRELPRREEVQNPHAGITID